MLARRSLRRLLPGLLALPWGLAAAASGEARGYLTAWQPAWQPGRAVTAASTASAPERTTVRRDVVVTTLLAGGAIAGGLALRGLRGGAVASRMAVVDSAVHVWKKDPAYPWAKEAAASPPGKDASAEELLELMDANSVDKTVIVQPICYRYDNSYVQDTIAKWPERFAGVARVDPEDRESPEALEKLTAAGFVGVRFGPVEEEWWTAPAMVRQIWHESLTWMCVQRPPI
jgi:hypothetical protein